MREQNTVGGCCAQRLRVALVSGVVAGSSAVAIAQDAPNVADRLSAMEAQLQLLQKQGALNQARLAVAGSQVAALPKVLAIGGFEGDLAARLLLANGNVANVREGEVIRTGLSIAAITPKAVMVKVGTGKNTSTLPLEFVSGAATGVSGGLGLPGTAMPVPLELLPPLPSVNVGARIPRPPATPAPATPVVQAPRSEPGPSRGPVPAAVPPGAAAPPPAQAGPASPPMPATPTANPGLPVAPAPSR